MGFLQNGALEDLTNLAWRHRQHESRQEDKKAVPPRNLVDADALEIILPLEESETVVERREGNSRTKSPPREGKQRALYLGKSGCDDEDAVDRYAEKQCEDKTAEENGHGRASSGRTDVWAGQALPNFSSFPLYDRASES